MSDWRTRVLDGVEELEPIAEDSAPFFYEFHTPPTPRAWERNYRALRLYQKSWAREVAPGFLGSVLYRWLEREAVGVQPLRVLFAGNGIKGEPWAFVYLGWDVVALDVSTTACAHLREYAPDDEALARWLPEWTSEPSGTITIQRFDLAKSLDALPAKHRPGGRMEAVEADFLDYRPARPFDIVYFPVSFTCLDMARQDALPERIFDWLVPGGTCLLHVRNIDGTAARPKPERRARVSGAFEAAGFSPRCEWVSSSDARWFYIYNSTG